MGDQDRNVTITIRAKNITGPEAAAAGATLTQLGVTATNAGARITAGMSSAGKAASASGQMISGMSAIGVVELNRLDAEANKPRLSIGQIATGAGAAAAGIAGVAASVAVLGESGAGIADVRDSFNGLTSAIGDHSAAAHRAVRLA